jgi:hypothetical protein
MIYFEQYYIQWKSAAQVGKGSTNALLEIRRIRENEEERVAERNWQTVEAGEKKKARKKSMLEFRMEHQRSFRSPVHKNDPIEVNICVSTRQPPFHCLTWQQ